MIYNNSKHDEIPVIHMFLGTVGPPVSKSGENDSSTTKILISVLVPLGCLIIITVFAFLIIFLLKKSRLDKFRHHLMPLYNFDPTEEEGDWESELLEEDREQKINNQNSSPNHGPKLKFSTDTLEL